ncbi:hypothetical protein GCM10027341_53960 [Spirosoma knui]
MNTFLVIALSVVGQLILAISFGKEAFTISTTGIGRVKPIFLGSVFLGFAILLSCLLYVMLTHQGRS